MKRIMRVLGHGVTTIKQITLTGLKINQMIIKVIKTVLDQLSTPESGMISTVKIQCDMYASVLSNLIFNSFF